MDDGDVKGRLACKECGAPATQIEECGTARCCATRDLRMVEVIDGALRARMEPWDVDPDDDDVTSTGFRCRECDAGADAFGDLVVDRVNAPVCACGHMRHEHPERPFDSQRYVRGLMPCAVIDCGCQDFEATHRPQATPGQLALLEGIEITPDEAKLIAAAYFGGSPAELDAAGEVITRISKEAGA